jgi:hypothetical protein
MAATTMAFSVAMLHGTRIMGYQYKPEEADALVQLWKYSGYLSGVNVGLLCSSEAEGMEWAEMIDLLQPGPDEDSLKLAKALRDVNQMRGDNAFEKAMMALMTRYHDGLTRATSGDLVADDLRIPNRHWKHAVTLTRFMVSPMEKMRERIPGATMLASLVGNQLWLTAVTKELQGKKPQYQAPERPKFEDRFPKVRRLFAVAGTA